MWQGCCLQKSKKSGVAASSAVPHVAVLADAYVGLRCSAACRQVHAR